jgi:sulfur carrier protein
MFTLTERMHPSITIRVNGEPRDIERDASLLDLLRRLELDPRLVVVEHNRRIVRRPALGGTALAAGDQIELVHFVGGG